MRPSRRYLNEVSGSFTHMGPPRKTQLFSLSCVPLLGFRPIARPMKQHAFVCMFATPCAPYPPVIAWLPAEGYRGIVSSRTLAFAVVVAAVGLMAVCVASSPFCCCLSCSFVSLFRPVLYSRNNSKVISSSKLQTHIKLYPYRSMGCLCSHVLRDKSVLKLFPQRTCFFA